METVLDDAHSVIKLYDENIGGWKLVRRDKGPFKSIEVIEEVFQKLGLSKNEIRVYVCLARSKERKASEISEALNLHRTETYRILRDLEKRGLVSSVFEKPLRFVAIPFEKAIDTLIRAKKLRIQQLERKKQNLVSIWSSLPQVKAVERRKEVFQILEGEEQIDLKADEMVQNIKTEISVFASEDDIARLYHSSFIDNLEKLSENNIDVRLLVNDSMKGRFFIKRTKLANTRCALTDAEDVPTFIIADRENLLLIIRKQNGNHQEKAKRVKVASLWTNYKAFTNTLDKLFSEMWKEEPPQIVTKSSRIKSQH